MFSAYLSVKKKKKLNALAHTIHANMHTDINITHTHTHTHTLTMVSHDFWKRLLKKESFELGLEVREGGEIPPAGRQRIPDSWGNETERTVANRGVLGVQIETAPLTSGDSIPSDGHEHRFSSDTQLSLTAPRTFLSHTLVTASAGA